MRKTTTLVIPFANVPQPEPRLARAAIIPVPWEASVSYGEGTALGPSAIMTASANMELYDEVLGCEPIAYGILTRTVVDVAGESSVVLARISEAVDVELAEGRLPALIGGEHTVTLGGLEALVARRGADFTVVVLDAHLDLRDTYEGDRLSHACVMRRAMDLGLAVRHLGVRSCSVEEAAFVQERGLDPLWAHQIHDDPHWLARALNGLEGPVYISLDIDGLDPGIMPATGTPEPGGLSWHQVTRWLAAVCARCPVVGLDLVELAPILGQSAWDFTAARLLYRTLGLALRNRK